MSNLASDLGALFGNDTLTAIGSNPLAQKAGNLLASTVIKKTPTPAPQVATAAPSASPINLDVADTGIMKKAAMAVGAVFAVLVGIYFFKKGRK